MVSSHSTSSCSTEQFHKILGWEDNFPDYKCYNSLFILQSQWYFSAIEWRKDSLFTVKMVLISITSDPNDFLSAPPPDFYGRHIVSSQPGGKPVHNWSNGTAGQAGNIGGGNNNDKTGTIRPRQLAGQSSNANVKQRSLAKINVSTGASRGTNPVNLVYLLLTSCTTLQQ